VQEGFTNFGFPAYLVPVLIGAKIAAAVAILTRVSVRLSDLAYAGIFYHLLLAFSAHLDAGDGGCGAALLALALLRASFFTQNAARKRPSPNAPGFPVTSKPPGPLTPAAKPD
jgi:DoxX-like family